MDTTSRTNGPPSPGFLSIPGKSNPGRTDDTLDRTSSSAHAAINTAANAAYDLSRKARPAIEQAASIAHGAVDKAVHAAAPGADWLDEQAESLDAARKELMAQTCAYVREHPLRSVGIALVAGYVFSRVVR